MRKIVGSWLVAAMMMAAPLSVGLTVSAAPTATATRLTTENASLFLPDSYEQYLSLQSPVDIAFSQHYIAIAEERTLYLFDRQKETPIYKTYTHSANISRIQFSETEKLYLSDAQLGFYNLLLDEEQALTAKKYDTSLTTFTIDGDTLYRATTTSSSGTTYLKAALSALTANSLEQEITIGTTRDTDTPQLAVSDECLYAAVGGTVLKYTHNSGTGIYDSTSFSIAQNGNDLKLKSVCILDSTLWYSLDGTSTEGGLYACDLTTNESKLVLSGNGYGALTSYDGKLYAVKGSSVIEYSVEDGLTPTGYEISAASDSVGRLSGAKDIAQTGGLLVIADSENQRISIVILDHDEEADSSSDISVIPCLDCDEQPYTPNLVATDGEIIAVASLDEKKSSIYLYRFGILEYVSCHSLEEPVIGLTCVDGECYFITENGYGKAEDGFKTFCRNGENPVAITADDCGDIYVVDAGGCMQKYTAEEFANCEIMHGIEQEMTFPSTPTSLQIDGKGEFYYMRDKKLYMNETELFDLEDHSLIYGEIGDPSSFAVDFDCGEIYLLYPYYIIRIRLGTDGR